MSEPKQAGEIQPLQKPSVDYKKEYTHIILTEEEIDFALYQVRKKKDALERENAYWDKVRKSEEPLILNGVGMKNFIIERAKKMGIDLIIDQFNEKEFNLLIQYFTKDPAFEQDGRSLKKGILIQGGIGCGKTTLMRLFMENMNHSFFTVTCNSVASAFSLGGYKGKDGNDGIDKYFHPVKFNRDPFGFTTRGFCFDDLGTERAKKHYGNEANVMEEIILGWYDGLNKRTERIHITTNLTADEIGEQYGPRVRSRMREMFNVINFDLIAPDRRK